MTAVHVHRWLYSRAVPGDRPRFLALDGAGRLLLAGDGFGGPRVEYAALSGLEAAERLLGPGDG